jgi:uncharacterized protein
MAIETYIYIVIAGFFAGFLDAIVGGGGLIMTPAMISLFPDFDILRIIATNRTSSIVGTSTAAWSYFRNVKIHIKIVAAAAIAAMLMGAIGAQLASYIAPKTLKIIVLMVIIAIAIYTYFKKDFGQDEQLKYDEGSLPKAAAIVGAICGFYNGLIGPGTGTILVFTFVSVVGFSFLRASAISKVTNVCGDIGSWIVLCSKGYIFWTAAFPLIVSNVIGSFIGSRLAILKGNQFIRSVFLFVVLCLIAKILFDLWRMSA